MINKEDQVKGNHHNGLWEGLSGVERLAPPKEPHAGDTCPACGLGNLDYNGMLDLECDQCGYALAGCFT